MVIWLRYHPRSVKLSIEFTLKSSCSWFSQKLCASQLWIRNSTANFYLVVYTFSASIYCSTHTFHFSLFSLSLSLIHLNSCVQTYLHPWNVILKPVQKIFFSQRISICCITFAIISKLASTESNNFIFYTYGTERKVPVNRANNKTT